MALREVEVEVGHRVHIQRVWALLNAAREPGINEFLNAADQEQLRVIGQKLEKDRTHADAAWLAGKVAAVCSVEHPHTVKMSVDDGHNPNAIRPA